MQHRAWDASDGTRPSLSNDLARLDKELEKLQRGPRSGAMPPAVGRAAPVVPGPPPATPNGIVAGGSADCGSEHCVPCEALAALERAEAVAADRVAEPAELELGPVRRRSGNETVPATATVRCGFTVRKAPRLRTSLSYLALTAAAGVGYYVLNLPALEAWSARLDTLTTHWIVDRRPGDAALRPAVMRWTAGEDKALQGAARFAPHANASHAIEAGLRGSRAKTLGSSPAILVDVLGRADENHEVRLPLRLVGLDGRGAISSLLIKSLPAGASLSAGRQLDDGRWALAPGDLEQLTVRLEGQPMGDHDLELELIGHDGMVLASNALRLSIIGGAAQTASAQQPMPQQASLQLVGRTPSREPARAADARSGERAPEVILTPDQSKSTPTEIDQPRPARQEAIRERAKMASHATLWRSLVRSSQVPADSAVVDPKTLAARGEANPDDDEARALPSPEASKAAPRRAKESPASEMASKPPPAKGTAGLDAAPKEAVKKEPPKDPDKTPFKPTTAGREGRVETTAATLPRKPSKPVEVDASPQKSVAQRPTVDVIQGPRSVTVIPNKPTTNQMPAWSPFQQHQN